MHRKKQIRSQERHPLNTRCPELQIRSLTSVPDAELRPPLAVVGRSGPEPGSVADSKWRSSRRALVPHGYRRRADPEPRFTSLASLRSGGVEDRRSGEGEDGGVEHTTSRSTSTEMARSSVTVRVRESETEGRGGHVHGGAGAEMERPRAETGDGGDGREARRRSQSQRRGATERVRGAIGN